MKQLNQNAPNNSNLTEGPDGMQERKPSWLQFLKITSTLAIMLIASMPAWGQGCPNINAIGNFLPSTLVGASFVNGTPVVQTTAPFGTVNTVSTYTFNSWSNTSPVSGVPGLGSSSTASTRANRLEIRPVPR